MLGRGAGSTQNLFLSFLICNGKTCMVLQKRCKIRTCFGTWTVFMHGMDLELCAGDGCENWPKGELVPPKISP